MDDLSLQLEQKKVSRRRSKYRDRAGLVSNDALLELFPLPRYFQVHFSHLHENVEPAKHQIDELKRSVGRVEEKIDRLLAALTADEF